MAKATKKSVPKTPIPGDEKLERQDFDLFKAIDAIDRKDYNYLNTLTEEQRRKFVPYMMTHWISAVKGHSNIAAYYLMSTDLNANKHLVNEYVSKHPELQWLMLCSASPGIGKQFHQWIPHLKAGIGELRDRATSKEVAEYFAKIYKGADGETISEVAKEFTIDQNHKYRLAQIYPGMKVEDIEVLSKIVSSEDIDRYERDAGIR